MKNPLPWLPIRYWCRGSLVMPWGISNRSVLLLVVCPHHRCQVGLISTTVEHEVRKVCKLYTLESGEAQSSDQAGALAQPYEAPRCPAAPPEGYEGSW